MDAEKTRRSHVSHRLDTVLSLSYVSFFLLWVASTFLFAFFYFFLSYVDGNGPAALVAIGNPVARFLNALYFSAITATSTGYGDIVPAGISKAFAALQSMSSIIILALFVAKFASSKQEIALEHIHEMSFDTSFHSIRQGLFIARKDLDFVIKKVLAKETLDQKDWRNLRIAFHQVHIFIRQIPNLYSVQHRHFGIDTDRERLLLDSVERTLHRILESLDIFDHEGISYVDQHGCMRELKELAALGERIFLSLKDSTTDTENVEAFQEVINRIDMILKHVEQFLERKQ